MNKKQKIIYMVSGVLLVLFTSWIIFDGIPVEAYKVKKQDALKGVTVTGTVKSREDILIASNITGNIEKIYVQEGQYVEKGQIIATLIRKEPYGLMEAALGKMDAAYWDLETLLTEPVLSSIRVAKIEIDKVSQKFSVLEHTIKRAKIDLADAKIDEERYKSLEKAGAVSKREYEQKVLKRKELETTVGETQEQIHSIQDELKQATENLHIVTAKYREEVINVLRAKLKAAEGDTLAAEGNLDNYVLKAPVSGIITDKILHTGDIVSPNTPVARLIVPHLIYLSMDVEENELQFIKKGQRALAIFDAYPDRVLKCFVTQIEKQVNPLTGTFEVRLSEPKENVKLNVGMTLDSTIITGESKNSLIIPTDFVTQKNGTSFVYVKYGIWTRKKYVKAEFFDNNRTKILSGLKEGDIILKSNEKNKLKNNKHIKIKDYYKL